MWFVASCRRGFIINLSTHCLFPGPEAADHGLGPTPHLHHRNVQHHRRVGHGGVERDSPQDRIWLQPDRPRLPWPQLPGQCPDRAVGPGGWRGQLEGLMASWAGTMEHNPPCPAMSLKTGTLHDGPKRSQQLCSPQNTLQRWWHENDRSKTNYIWSIFWFAQAKISPVLSLYPSPEQIVFMPNVLRGLKNVKTKLKISPNVGSCS